MGRENLHPIGIPQALTEITALEQQVFSGGNVDSEKDSFANIIELLKLQSITPEEALLRAHQLVDGRQEYH